MTEAKYTPGPWIKAERLNGPWWHISSEYTIGGNRCIGGRQAIACVHGESKRGSVAYSEMFEANARLIAVAPAMLQRLEMCKRFLEDMHTQSPEVTVAVSQTLHETVSEIIAQATGK